MAGDDYPYWLIKRRRKSLISTEGFFRDIDETIEAIFREMQESVSKELIKEEKLPDGRTMKRAGSMIHGYSVTVGPEGKPVISARASAVMQMYYPGMARFQKPQDMRLNRQTSVCYVIN